MKTFEIHGASDDLVETSGLPGCDEFCIVKNTPYIGKFVIQSSSGSVGIHAIYDGHWAFAVGAEDGDYDEMPDWEITREWGGNSPYSETVRIECPDDAVFAKVK